MIELPTESCAGCTACASGCPRGAIAMEPDEFGFLYPAVNPDTCIQCGLCERVCPVLNWQTEVKIPEVYAAYANDTALRLQSSSGGIFSLLALEILRRGGVVYGAAYDESFFVRHVCVETEDALGSLRGAKYAQSNLDGIFRDVKMRLEVGQKVLFSGTPCQTAGLKAYLCKDYADLCCVDFICHGVPSPKAWLAYVSFRAQQDRTGEVPTSINLRAKNTGWSHYRYSNRFTYKNGSEYSEFSGQNLYMRLFCEDYVNRISCADCHFKGYSHSSDITLGDFWGIWDVAPEMDDDKGTSLVLIHSPRGKQLWHLLSEKIAKRAVTPEEASRENPSLLRSSPAKDSREQMLREVCEGNFAFAECLFPKTKAPTLFQRVRGKLRRMLKM